MDTLIHTLRETHCSSCQSYSLRVFSTQPLPLFILMPPLHLSAAAAAAAHRFLVFTLPLSFIWLQPTCSLTLMQTLPHSLFTAGYYIVSGGCVSPCFCLQWRKKKKNPARLADAETDWGADWCSNYKAMIHQASFYEGCWQCRTLHQDVIKNMAAKKVKSISC